LGKTVQFDVLLAKGSNRFEILEVSDNNSLKASGHVSFVEDASTPFFYDSIDVTKEAYASLADRINLNADDIYKELQLRGYEYGISVFWRKNFGILIELN
jgi:hypothetical protein